MIPRPAAVTRATLTLAALALALAPPRLHTALSPLAEPPDWNALDRYQQSITRERFMAELERVYAPDAAWQPYIEVGRDSARILMSSSAPQRHYTLRFAPAPEKTRAAPRYWRRASEIGGQRPGRPLAGARIALDPGHLGGGFARLEERWFKVGDNKPVIEGDMTLLVARKLQRLLERKGADVSLLRRSSRPATNLRPDDLRDEARAELRRMGVGSPPLDSAERADGGRHASVRWQSERLFYRSAEIRARADRVNRKLRPDLVVALHFNAEPWGDPERPRLRRENHLHLLVNGAYSRAEVGLDDNRFFMLRRILQGIHAVELAAAESVAESMAAATGLPPYIYQSNNAIRVGGNRYVYARNLLANRTYLCPVVYLEPYVMNSREVHARLQAGDYDGLREVAGKKRPSIYREYAESVARGLLRYFAAQRGG